MSLYTPNSGILCGYICIVARGDKVGTSMVWCHNSAQNHNNNVKSWVLADTLLTGLRVQTSGNNELSTQTML